MTKHIVRCIMFHRMYLLYVKQVVSRGAVWSPQTTLSKVLSSHNRTYQKFRGRGGTEPLKSTLERQPTANYESNNFCITVSCKCMNGNVSQISHCNGLVHVFQ